MEQRSHSKNHNHGDKFVAAITEGAQEQIEEIRARVGEVNERVVTFIKKRPATALLIAAGAGYLIGRILRS